jgi:antitoxin component of RelBE/YafQ-DinJ toxin-antitoxin module
MTSQVIFKIDKGLKEKAMKKAQTEGVTFSSVLKLATQAYVKGNLDVELVAQPKLNAKTRRELIKISKDIKEGKNMVGPFGNAEDAIAYLKSR